jgi:hypothetical protein
LSGIKGKTIPVTSSHVLQSIDSQIFFNPILFANCTGTFSKLCNVTEACRGALSNTPPYLTGPRPRVSVGNKTYKIHLKD